jgi:hypothetical protein
MREKIIQKIVQILPPVFNIRESLFFRLLEFLMYFGLYYRLDTLETKQSKKQIFFYIKKQTD